MPSDHTDDVPETTGADSAEHDPIAIIRSVLGPVAIDLWGTRKLRQLVGELLRAEDAQKARVVDAEFEQFWAVYPRKDDKLRAAKAFRQAKRDAGAEWPTIFQEIMAKAPRADEDASADHFVPLPSTWLQDERWTDEDERWEKDDEWWKDR